MLRAMFGFALLLPAFAGSPSERIGTIDFYGLADLTPASLHLPFHEGDGVPSDEVVNETQKRLSEMTGRKAEISRGCCLQDGRSTVYVGLAEPNAPSVQYNSKPAGDTKLPDEVLQIFQDFDRHWNESVVKGDSAEDDSQGYALSHYPPLRADQMKLRDWARANTDLALRVLAESRFRQQRANAAWAIGYADRSSRQISALVTASFDPDGEVRNNAVRALEVLCDVGPEVTRQIPADRFIPLLHSLRWTDRNKASVLLAAITQSREPALLKKLHDEALVPLREMAQWKNPGHAFAALAILGRIGGIEETRLIQMIVAGDAGILNSVH